jgi:hypothetical protein
LHSIPSAPSKGPTAQPPEHQRSIDVTGLLEEAIRAVESLVALLRGQAASTPPAPASPEDWTKEFDAWMHEVAARAGQYPPSFVFDDSRETIYEGRGE